MVRFKEVPLKPCPLCAGKLEYADKEKFTVVWCTSRSCHYYLDMDSDGEEHDDDSCG